MRKFIGDIIKKNVFISDLIYGIYSAKSEIELKKNIEYLTEIDTLEHIEEIEKFTQKCKLGKSVFSSKNRNKANERIYGIKPSIFQGIEDRNVFFPTIEHGLIFYDFVDTHIKETMRPTVVTFGEFRKSILRQYSDTPVFCVGPYIHYAPEYYDKETMLKKKKKLGKNLLVFPQHSTESAVLSDNDRRFIEKIEKEAVNYDSVTVSAFWWNINDALIKKLKAMGYKIVCNGFREDPKFLSRQKATIELCDAAIGDGIGTHVGYCIHLGKPYKYFDSEMKIKVFESEEIEHLEYRENIVNCIKKEFLGDSITKTQRIICKKYWGEGNEKNEEEIKAIYEINKEIIKRSKGISSRYRHAIEEYITELDKSTLHYKLLKEAME